MIHGNTGRKRPDASIRMKEFWSNPFKRLDAIVKIGASQKGRIPWNKEMKIDKNKYPNMGFPRGNLNPSCVGQNPFQDKHHTEKTKKILAIKIKKDMENPFRREQSRQGRMKQKIPNKMTSIELKIKELLNNLHIPYKMHKPIMNITQPDFFIEPNICIYCDGDYWHSKPKTIERDKRINKILRYAGYKVIRLTEKQIKSNIISCKEAIYEETNYIS